MADQLLHDFDIPHLFEKRLSMCDDDAEFGTNTISVHESSF